MSVCLGIDTSNYTTSAALYDADTGAVLMARKLLPVRQGERGLRQSDAVFHHVRQLPDLLEQLMRDGADAVAAVGVSSRPRSVDGSYMPCFTVGEGAARELSAVLRIPLYRFSHQQGHIAAALYSADRLDLLYTPHIAFHVSGGTTEALLVNGEQGLLTTRLLAHTLDLNAGQLIDRVGVMMGLSFPCGKELEKLAARCTDTITVRPTIKGGDCCLSGIENQCRKLLYDGYPVEYIARFTLLSVQETIYEMCERIERDYPDMPVVFAGGVMSNALIRESIQRRISCVFASPEYSTDNAAGIALLAAITGES